MDKRVIFAVAGSGKTSYLIEQLNEDSRFLLVTYTNNNLHNLRAGIINKFGYIPCNIKIYSYFTFLYSFCFKPFLNSKVQTKGINFDQNINRYLKSDSREYYIDKFDRIYSSRISKLLIETEEYKNVINRIEKYTDYLLIDEIQDFAGNDFNLLKYISAANINHIYVGDFFQHTFDTSRDGMVNSGLHDNFSRYIDEFKKMGLELDETTLSKSYRCSPTICRFIYENLGIRIESYRKEETKIIFIEDKSQADEIFNHTGIIKLFFKEHYRFNCFSRNWGDSKGENKYFDVCVILNKTTLEHFQKRELNALASSTKNKFYVALSRAKNDLYFIPYTLLG